MTLEDDRTTVDGEDLARAEFRRACERWTDDEHEHLIWCLRNGESSGDVALALGRSVSGIQARCYMMMPAEIRTKRSAAEMLLRELLGTDPGYDWRAGLREDARRRGAFYWDTRADDVLRDGWGRARDMLTLLAATGASELEVVRRLRVLGLAESRQQIAERVGCVPNGTFAISLKLAEDRAAAAVWILHVTGLCGEADPYISTHANRADADGDLTRLQDNHRENDGDRNDVRATIVTRTVGEGGIDSATD